MTVQRTAYTAGEVCRLIGVSNRTLRRWRREAKHFHPWQDEHDPRQGWLYDVEEVLAYRRKYGRGSGVRRIASVGRDVAVSPWTLEPTLPGPVAGRVYARLKRGEPLDDICNAESVAPEQVIRLEQIRRQFEAERVHSSRPPPSAPRMIIDESDPEIAAVARELDEERRDAASGDDEGDEDD